MKNFTTIFLLALFSTGNLPAQLLSIKESTIEIEETETDAQVATLLIQDDGEIKKALRKYIRRNLDAKVKNNGKDMLMAEKASIHTISDKRGDLAAIFFQENSQDKMAVAYLLGYDIFVNSNDYPEEAENLKNFAETFLKDYYQGYFEDVVTAEEKKLKKLERGLAKNGREINSLNRKIQKNNRKAERDKFKDEKDSLENDNVRINTEIDALNDAMAQLKNDIAKVEKDIQVAKENVALFY